MQVDKPDSGARREGCTVGLIVSSPRCIYEKDFFCIWQQVCRCASTGHPGFLLRWGHSHQLTSPWFFSLSDCLARRRIPFLAGRAAWRAKKLAPRRGALLPIFRAAGKRVCTWVPCPARRSRGEGERPPLFAVAAVVADQPNLNKRAWPSFTSWERAALRSKPQCDSRVRCVLVCCWICAQTKTQKCLICYCKTCKPSWFKVFNIIFSSLLITVYFKCLRLFKCNGLKIFLKSYTSYIFCSDAKCFSRLYFKLVYKF